jgi:hypothetical protein
MKLMVDCPLGTHLILAEWRKYIAEVTLTALKKEPEESNFSEHPTISLSAYTAETEETILGTRFDEKIKDVKVKVKQSRYRLGVAQSVPGV